MRRLYFTVLFILLFSAGLSAQSGEFSPFVTQIIAEARNNLISLTWTDSPDVTGPVYIFRSTRPFSGVIPANIRPVAVRYGEQYYIDDIDDVENLYYFIAASDTSGRRYDIILPGINSTVPDDEALAQEISGITAPEQTEGIHNIKAVQDGDRVIITFDSSASSGRNAILYRSTLPVNAPQDMLHAVIVQPRITSPYVDLPVPGISFYYTIIFEDDIANGTMEIKPGINSTVSAVKITDEQNQERSLRPIPLPMLTLRNAMPESFFITDAPLQIPLGAESSGILRDIQMPLKEPLEYKKPRVFSSDLIAPAGGEESALFQIVMEHFSKFEWDNAVINLQNYLSLPRTKEVEARARFYLAQAYYYTGNYREALMEFLVFRTYNPAEANNWIDAVLSAMVY